MTADQPTDDLRDLLLRWQAGDASAIGTLLADHLAFIREHVQRRLGTKLRRKQESGDIVHEVALELLQYGPRFVLSDQRRFRGLLVRMIENTMRDENRWFNARRRAVSRERPLGEDSSIDLDLPFAPDLTPSELGRRNERDSAVRLCLEVLRPSDRDVLVLREWEELSFGQIAERLNLTETAARVRYTRALRRLATKMKQLKRGAFEEFAADEGTDP